VLTYNAAIPGLVNSRAAAGKQVVLLDNYAAFTSDPNYRTSLMVDYLHPNAAGYAVLGRAFFGAIGALLQAGP
jgi:lysophospholipase L1-like esterase